MEIVTRKRLRSDDSPYILQQKIRVNEKIVNNNDINRMKKIHDKTMKLLFSAARNLNDKASSTTTETKKPLYEEISLNGNGALYPRHVPNSVEEQTKRTKQKVLCCARQAFIDAECKNCQVTLCEFCGYSCAECYQFLCNRCVSLFGCGNTDRPICSNCSFFD